MQDSSGGGSVVRRKTPRQILAIIGFAVLVLIIAAALWNLATGNRVLLSGAVAAAAGFGAWRTWRLVRPSQTQASPTREPPPKAPGWVKAFGIIGIAVFILILMVAIANQMGLDTGHGPGRHMNPSDGQQNAGVGGPADASDATRTINVTTFDNMTFQPTTITVSSGETVTFVVTNTGQADHEFVLGDAKMQQQHATMRSHMGSMTPHDSTNSVHVQPGETKRLTWRFGDAGIEYACHEPDHYGAGMRGQVVIA